MPHDNKRPQRHWPLVSGLATIFVFLYILTRNFDATPVRYLLKSAGNLIVETEFGAVLGRYAYAYRPWSSPRLFLGIPYADPPVNKLRFAPTQPYSSSWVNSTIPRLAISYPPSCPQVSAEYVSEDCLYLNIYAPSRRKIEDNKTVPVMIWIHGIHIGLLSCCIIHLGGGFMHGSAEEYTLYDGSYLVEKEDIVVVTLNYRLGAFGFLVNQKYFLHAIIVVIGSKK